MRGVTHTLLGAAVALPIAVSRDPAIALGCVWFGMVGGGLPDWIDLRSEFKTTLRLKHRGTSHSLFMLAICVAMFSLILVVLQRSAFSMGGFSVSPEPATIQAWVLCLGLGFASHLLSDACTMSGIRPLLPFSQFRMWLLPSFLRSRSDGYLDTVLRWMAIIALSFGMVVFAARWIVWP